MKIIEISKDFQELINSDWFSLAHVGIRWDDRHFNIGDEIPNSNSYDITGAAEEDQGEELCGVCAIGIDNGTWFDSNDELIAHIKSVLKDTSAYPGQYTYIVKGNGSDIGEDNHEIIIHNAEVVAIVEL